MNKPQTWHYGLVAQQGAEFNVEGSEIACFQKLIERYGQPALDVACGTGRLLLPYLRAGLNVDGCDIWSDMLALCREKAEREGLSPRLYEQAMHELDLPCRYKTIYVSSASASSSPPMVSRWGMENKNGAFFGHAQDRAVSCLTQD